MSEATKKVKEAEAILRHWREAVPDDRGAAELGPAERDPAEWGPAAWGANP